MKKKITKRIFTLLLAAMLVFPFASCGGMHTIIVNRSGQVRSQYDYITLTYDIVQ